MQKNPAMSPEELEYSEDFDTTSQNYMEDDFEDVVSESGSHHGDTPVINGSLLVAVNASGSHNAPKQNEIEEPDEYVSDFEVVGNEVIVDKEMTPSATPEGPKSKRRNRSPARSGPDSAAWKRELREFSGVIERCMGKDRIRIKGVHAIESCIAGEIRHPRIVLEKNLQLSLKKINSYRKENMLLLQKLDQSVIYTEFEQLKNTITDQEIKIQKLQEENKSLLRVNRNQEKGLLEQERNKEDIPVKVQNTEKQNEYLIAKIRAQQVTIAELQTKERSKYEENAQLKQKIHKLKERLILHQDHSTVNPVHEQGSHASNMTSLLTTNTNDPEQDLVVENYRLKNIIKAQKASASQEHKKYKKDLEKYISRIESLEYELAQREKEMKAQV